MFRGEMAIAMAVALALGLVLLALRRTDRAGTRNALLVLVGGPANATPVAPSAGVGAEYDGASPAASASGAVARQHPTSPQAISRRARGERSMSRIPVSIE